MIDPSGLRWFQFHRQPPWRFMFRFVPNPAKDTLFAVEKVAEAERAQIVYWASNRSTNNYGHNRWLARNESKFWVCPVIDRKCTHQSSRDCCVSVQLFPVLFDLASNRFISARLDFHQFSNQSPAAAVPKWNKNTSFAARNFHADWPHSRRDMFIHNSSLKIRSAAATATCPTSKHHIKQRHQQHVRVVRASICVRFGIFCSTFPLAFLSSLRLAHEKHISHILYV